MHVHETKEGSIARFPSEHNADILLTNDTTLQHGDMELVIKG